MQVDSTHITVDDKENPFLSYGTTIVGNITAYTSFDDEAEEEERKKHVEERN